MEVRHLSFVEVADARGESRRYIVAREILPNILAPIGVDFGIRLASSIVVVAGVSLPRPRPAAAGCGLGPDHQREPLGTHAAALGGGRSRSLAIGFLTVGINLVIDGLRRGSRRTLRAALEAETVAVSASTPGTSTGVGATGVLAVEGLRVDALETAATSSPTSSFASRPGRDARHRRRVGLAARRRWRWRCSAWRGPGRASPRARRHRRHRRAAAAREPRAARAARRAHRVRAAESGDRAQPGHAHRRGSSTRSSSMHLPRDRDRGERVRADCGWPSCPDDDAFLRRYPHQLSGGQQQRVCIAMALVCEPDVIVMDEPTTGLDVTTQARLLDEIRGLAERLSMAIVYVSHDLGVVAQHRRPRRWCMYGGRDRRGRRRSTSCSASRGIPTRGACSRRSRAVDAGARAAARHPGTRGRAVEPAVRLRVRAALRRSCRGLPGEMPPLEREATAHVRCLRWRELGRPRPRARARAAGAPSPRTPAAARASTGLRRRLRAIAAAVAAGVAPSTASSFAVRRGRASASSARAAAARRRCSAASPACTSRRRARIALDGAPLAASSRDRSHGAAPRASSSSPRTPTLAQSAPARRRDRRAAARAVLRPGGAARGRSRRRAAGAGAPAGGVRRSRCRVSCQRRREAARRDRPRPGRRARAPALRRGHLGAGRRRAGGHPRRCSTSCAASSGPTLVFVSHDLAVVRSLSDDVVVMREGVVREAGAVRAAVRRPAGPYTRDLLAAVPRLQPDDYPGGAGG